MKKINCIFLIDDNPADNLFHKLKIRAAGVCNIVQVAVNGMDALDYLASSSDPALCDKFPKPQLIFLDINLPGINGFEFLDEYQLFAEEMKSHVIVIMLTTSLNPDDERKAKGYEEVKDFIIKPLTEQKVRDTVDKFF